MMSAPTDILISVDGKHAANMLLGKKTVELRRRRLHVEPGTRVWVYSKLPRGHVELVATVDQVLAASPTTIWRAYGSRSAVSWSEFQSYFRNASTGYAILFRQVLPLQRAIRLDTIRRISSNFHPPQFFKRLPATCPELEFFLGACSSSRGVYVGRGPRSLTST